MRFRTAVRSLAKVGLVASLGATLVLVGAGAAPTLADGTNWSAWGWQGGTLRLWGPGGDECAEVSNGSAAQGTLLAVTDCAASAAQTFSPTGTNELRIPFSSECMDVQWGGTNDGTPIQEWSCNGSTAQHWFFQNMHIQSSLHYVDATRPKQCVDVPWNNWVSGAAVWLWDCADTTAQNWTFNPGTGLISGANGLCLSVANGVATDGQLIKLAPCQKWVSAQNWIAGSNGFESALNRNMCMDIQWSGTNNGTPIQLWDCNRSDVQTWMLRGSIHGLAGKCLAIPSFDSNQVALETCQANLSTQDWDYWMPTAQA